MEKDEKDIITPVNDTIVDEPIEDPTLATTDEVIPAPVDVPGTEITDPIAEPVLDAPLADIAPPMQDIPVDAPVVDDIVGPGPETTCDCDDPNCNGCCGTEPCSSSVTVANYFGTLQECVTIVWRFHLKTKKHHIHVALNTFYEKALDIVDDIIEQYQGICGVIEEPFTNCIVGDGKTEGEYLTELKAFVENNRCVLGCHSEIDSTIDEFLALIDSTNYLISAFTESNVKSFEEFCYEDYPSIRESCSYDRYGERSCDDPDDPDYDDAEEE